MEFPPEVSRNKETLTLPSKQSSTSAPPPFQQPSQICSFSYSPSRELLFDDSALKYFVYPPKDADLAYRYAEWIKRPEERSRLDGLLDALMQEKCLSERNRAGVVTWRGVMTRIMVAPYEENEGWALNVMRVGDTIYLEEHADPETIQQKEAMNPRQRLYTYYGYSFESWCTTAQPPSRNPRPTWGGDVNTNVQWASVVKTKIGSTRLILGGEVDCVRDRYTGQPDTFVELKTSMSFRRGYAQDEVRFEKKLLKFYFQSFLIGCPEIVVGFRNTRGRIQTVQSFRTMELPRMVRNKPGAWDPAICLAWSLQVLDFLSLHTAQQEAEKDETRVWRVTFKPSEGLYLWLLNEDEVSLVREGEDRVGFLPRRYWNDINGLA